MRFPKLYVALGANHRFTNVASRVFDGQERQGQGGGAPHTVRPRQKRAHDLPRKTVGAWGTQEPRPWARGGRARARQSNATARPTVGVARATASNQPLQPAQMPTQPGQPIY